MPLPRPVTSTTRIELGPDAERLFQRTLAEVRALHKRRSWWRTLLWCWALRRRGFWRDRFWRCGLCLRAVPVGREKCHCEGLGPYRDAGPRPLPRWAWRGEAEQRELVRNWPVTRNGAVPELPDPLPPTRRQE